MPSLNKLLIASFRSTLERIANEGSDALHYGEIGKNILSIIRIPSAYTKQHKTLSILSVREMVSLR